MQVVVLLFEQHIGECEQRQGGSKVDPMPSHKRQSRRGRKRRAEVYEAQRHSELQQRVEGRNLHMPYPQFIGHQLVRMLAVRLAQVLMQPDAMAYGKASVHAIDQQEYEICHVARSENERAYEEEEDICHDYFILFGTEIMAEISVVQCQLS